MTNLSNKLSLLPNRKASRTQSRKLKGVIAALTCSLFFSCENPALYDQYQAINNITWEKDKEYYFTFEVKDISVPYDLTLEVRNNNLYPYQNLWLFCSEEQPIGRSAGTPSNACLPTNSANGTDMAFPYTKAVFPFIRNISFRMPDNIRSVSAKGCATML